MVTKQVKFTDLDGVDHVETLMFHLNKLDLLRLEAKYKAHGGLHAYLSTITGQGSDDDMDFESILAFFEEIVKMSYGVRDGDRFIKDPGVTEKFVSSEAYPTFMYSFGENENSATEFLIKLIPNAKSK